MVEIRKKLFGIAFVAGLIQGCGGAGQGSQDSCGLCGDRNDLNGSITSQFGTQDQMQGWVSVLIEKDSNVSRVAEVDSNGGFTFKGARTDVPHTLALLSPDYILQAVLSIPGDPTFIHQFFQPTQPNLPRLIHSGPIIRMQNLSGVDVTGDLAKDTSGDGIPDGSVSIGAVEAALHGGFNLQEQAIPDLDGDFVLNDVDPDIDGDGIINILDPDDDGDAIYDVLDVDANGDYINDSTQTIGNLYFPEGVEFIAVQFEMRPKADGSGNEQSLIFTTKVRDEVGPDSVQIRGAKSLLGTAQVSGIDPETEEVTQVVWDGTLQDDGLSNDSSEGDRIFGQRVTLVEGATPPRAHEMIFFQLAFGTAEDATFIEFPYTFPNLKPAAVTAKYEPNTRTVLLVSNPYGEVLDFLWSINLFNADGLSVWSSQPISGRTRQFAIPDNVMVEGTTYQYSVVAQVLDKVPGYPTYTIHSVKYDIP